MSQNTLFSLQSDHIESYSCRFCLEEGVRRDFIAPCNCAGTSKWVHRHCLDQWRSTREDKAFSKCTECHAYYDMICVTNDSWSDACCRRSRFCLYLSRDLLLLVLVSQLVVFLFAGFIYLIDFNGHSLYHLSRMHNATLFYYSAGWFVALALIGMLALCFRNQFCESCSRNSNDVYCGDLICPYNCFCFDPTPICAYCGSCESCATCECAQCTALSCGEEMLGVVFIAGIILAVIGVFVSVVFGFIILQHVIRRHISVLNKWNLTREFIVKDLASGAMGVEEILEERKRVRNRDRSSRQDEENSDTNVDDQNVVNSVIHLLSGRTRYDPPLLQNQRYTPSNNLRTDTNYRHSYYSVRAPHQQEHEYIQSDSSEVEMMTTSNPLLAPVHGNESMEREINRVGEENDYSHPLDSTPSPALTTQQRAFLERNRLL